MGLSTGTMAATIVLALAAQTAWAATWYVSAEGSDQADGVSPGSALRTLGQAGERARRGDTIRLRRGDVFRESVELAEPELVIEPYGPTGADRPVISGSEPITGWQRWKGDIWVASTEHTPGYLYADGQLMLIARYPNTGWLRSRDWQELSDQADGATTALRSPGLLEHPRKAPGYWTGATVRWRHHSWWYETRPIVGYDGQGELRLGDRSASHNGPHRWDTKGWGFYLDGKLEELDAPGEWYFDAQAGRVYLWPPEGQDPNAMLVEGTVRPLGLDVTTATVRDLVFRHQQNVGLSIDGRFVVERCLFDSIGQDAVVSQRNRGGSALHVTWSTTSGRIGHCEFRNNLNNSLTWWQNPEAQGSSVIEHNTVIESGTVAGYGGSGSWHGVGILIGRGRNVRVQYNHIEGTGYAGILLGSDGNFAEYNVIRRAMSTMNDGAAIYTNCSRSTIRHNIILDTRGGMASSGDWANISHGIWLEFLGEYHHSIIENNTCVRSGGDGIFLTNNYECVVRGNVLFDNDRYQLLLTGRGSDEAKDTTQEHLIVGNVLAMTGRQRGLLYFDPRFDYGTLRGNVYWSPMQDAPIMQGHGWPGSGDRNRLSVSAWQEQFGWADGEAVVPAPQPAEPKAELFINDSEAVRTIELHGPYRDLAGQPVQSPLRLEPFTSVILMPAEAND